MRGRTAAAALLIGVVASSLPGAATAHTCATDNVLLGGFAELSSPTSPFYAAREGSANTPITIFRAACNHSGLDTATVTWSTPSGTAAGDVDYQDDSPNEASLPAPGTHEPPTSVTLWIPLFNDAEVEAMESYAVSLDAATPSKLSGRNPVPAYVVDDDGDERFMLEPGRTAHSHSEGNILLRVPVFRAGPPTSETTSVPYEIEPQTASASDFEDQTGGTATFAGGAWATTIDLRITNDDLQEPTEMLTITLGAGAATAETTTVTVNLLDNYTSKTETTNPRSRFHHPRHGLTYRYGDYRIREMHVFASDNLSGVQYVQMALRQRLTNGRCRWWKAGAFSRGPCRRKVWFRMRPPAYPDGPYFFRAPKLTPSRGTSVRNYTGFARAADKAGNQEVLFKTGRNANTFEVRRG